MGNCLNFAVGKTKYPYVAKFDDDDYYSPYYLTEQIKALRRTGASIVGKRAQMMYVEAIKRLKLTHPEVKVIVLTSFSDQDHVLPAIRAGARGYLLKDIEPEELVRAIRRVHQGQVELHSEVAGQLMSFVSAPEQAEIPNTAPSSLLSALTKRELDVLELIASGKSNKEIGETLFITEKTVKTHVSHLLDKLGLSDRTQAAIFAVKHGVGG